MAGRGQCAARRRQRAAATASSSKAATIRRSPCRAPRFRWSIPTHSDDRLRARRETHDSFSTPDKREPYFPEAFAKLQKALNDARMIVLTHFHADHVAGVTQAANFDELAAQDFHHGRDRALPAQHAARAASGDDGRADQPVRHLRLWRLLSDRAGHRADQGGRTFHRSPDGLYRAAVGPRNPAQRRCRPGCWRTSPRSKAKRRPG